MKILQLNINNMRRSTDEKVGIVKSYYKYENFAEVSRQWSTMFSTSTPKQQTMSAIVQRFETTGSVEDLPRPGRPKTSTAEDQKEAVKMALARRTL